MEDILEKLLATEKEHETGTFKKSGAQSEHLGGLYG